MSERLRRLTIGGLSVLGFAQALYMLAYEEGMIDSLLCPFFGEGCNIVGRSAQARHFGVPNAAVGALGYGVIGTLAALSGDEQAGRRPWPPLGVFSAAVAAVAASAILTWDQAVKVGAWCFWCLSSAVLNAAILVLSVPEARDAWRMLRAPERRRRRGSIVAGVARG